MKKMFAFLLIFVSFPLAFAIEEDSVHFGFNYSPTFQGGGNARSRRKRGVPLRPR